MFALQSTKSRVRNTCVPYIALVAIHVTGFSSQSVASTLVFNESFTGGTADEVWIGLQADTWEIELFPAPDCGPPWPNYVARGDRESTQAVTMEFRRFEEPALSGTKLSVWFWDNGEAQAMIRIRASPDGCAVEAGCTNGFEIQNGSYSWLLADGSHHEGPPRTPGWHHYELLVGSQGGAPVVFRFLDGLSYGGQSEGVGWEAVTFSASHGIRFDDITVRVDLPVKSDRRSWGRVKGDYKE